MQQLAALGLDPALPVMSALGVRPLLRHLAGALTREEAVEAAQTRDAAVREAAAHLGARKYDYVEMDFYERNGNQ